MRYAWIGFHLVMVLLLVLAFGGTFRPVPTGSFIQDSGNNANMIIGILFIWIVGAIVFRVIRRFSNY